MVQLKLLTAAQDPVSYEISRLPCIVGRRSSAQLRLEVPGVWDEHLQLELDGERRITARVLGGALLTLNGQSIQQATLRSGDVMELGSAKLQFWFSPTHQRDFRMLEMLTWVVLSVVALTQIAVIYGMLR